MYYMEIPIVNNVTDYTAVTKGCILHHLNLSSHEYHHSILDYQNKSKIDTVLVIYDPILDVTQKIDSNLKDILASAPIFKKSKIIS